MRLGREGGEGAPLKRGSGGELLAQGKHDRGVVWYTRMGNPDGLRIFGFPR